MQYKVIEGWHLISFENEVNSLLKQNWELLGGICAAYNRYEQRYVYTQAMIRKS